MVVLIVMVTSSLAAATAFGQSAFMNHEQSGYVLSGTYTEENNVSVYTLNAGKSVRGLTDLHASFGWTEYAGETMYAASVGVTPYLSLDRRHKAPALGGMPFGLSAVFPPYDNDVILTGAFGLELDFPLYWAPKSRLVLVGQGIFNYRLRPETTQRRTMGFLIGAEEGIVLTKQSTLLLGLAVVGQEHTDDVELVFEVGFIFPE